MYVLLNAKNFHKFWMSCECRNTQQKSGPEWGKPQPSLPHLGGRPYHLLTRPCHRSKGKATDPHCPGAMGFKVVQSMDPKDIGHGSKRPPACENQLGLNNHHNNHHMKLIQRVHEEVGATWQPSQAGWSRIGQ